MRRPAKTAIVAAVAIAAVFASTQVAFALSDVITPTDSSTAVPADTTSAAPADQAGAAPSSDSGNGDAAAPDPAPTDGQRPTTQPDPVATDASTDAPIDVATAAPADPSTDAPAPDPASTQPAASDSGATDPTAAPTQDPATGAPAPVDTDAPADPSRTAPDPVQTQDPAAPPTAEPSEDPAPDPSASAVPTTDPTAAPVATDEPTDAPTATPTDLPTDQQTPTTAPTAVATPTPLSAPAAPTVVVRSATSIRVTWTAPAGSFVNSEVDVDVVGNDQATPLYLADTADASVHSVDIGGLTPGTIYSITVHAIAAGDQPGPSSPSTSIALTVPTGVKVPTATAASAAAIAVDWRAAGVAKSGPAVTGYDLRVYRGATLALVRHLSATARSASVGDLAWHTTYTVRVVAKNIVGAATSSAARVTTANPTSAQRWAQSRYGSFGVHTWSGSQSTVVTLPKGVHAGMLDVAVAGKGISVTTLNGSNRLVESVVVRNGAYRGRDAFGVLGASGATKLRITAKAAWSVVLRPLSAAPALGAGGSGDGVFLRGGGAADVAFTNSSAGHALTVWQLGPSGGAANLVTSGTGRSSGTVPFVSGPTVVTVNAAGGWSVARR